MSLRACLYLLMAASVMAVSAWANAAETAITESNESGIETTADDSSDPIDLFDAIDQDLVEVTFIAKNDEQGRVIVANKTDKPVNFRMPEAFVGVPVLAQMGGGMGGGGMGGGGGGGQSVGGGGGMGGGGMGGGGMGGGGGAFSVEPEKAAKISVPLVCLEHGKRIPSSKKPYKIVRAEDELSSKPEVIELLTALGRGQLNRDAAQAAVWHSTDEMSWQELAAKLDGTERSTVRNAYFTAAQIQAAIAYHSEAVRLAAVKAAERSDSESADEAESMSEEGMQDRRSYDEAGEVVNKS
jgi:hypothetical protein